MNATMFNQETDQKSTLAISLSDHAIPNYPVDISVLCSFDEGHADGDPDLVVELIDLYLDDVPQKLKAMRAALPLRDSQSIRNVAHSLKGSSSSLGAYHMATLCNELESGANDQSSPDINTLLTGVEQEFERVHMAFSAERLRRV